MISENLEHRSRQEAVSSKVHQRNKTATDETNKFLQSGNPELTNYGYNMNAIKMIQTRKNNRHNKTSCRNQRYSTELEPILSQDEGI